MKNTFLVVFTILSAQLFGQVGSININVFDEFSRKPLSAEAKIVGQDQIYPSASGNIVVSEISSGTYTFEISAPGYTRSFLNEINVVPNQNLTFSVGLIKEAAEIQEVTLVRKTYKTTAE